MPLVLAKVSKLEELKEKNQNLKIVKMELVFLLLMIKAKNTYSQDLLMVQSEYTRF